MTSDDFPPWFVPSDCMLHSVGRHLGTRDPAVQGVALYLLSSPLLHRSGHYALPQTALLAHLNRVSEKIEAILEQLNTGGFCTYDFETEWVTVPLVKQIYTALGGAWAQDTVTCDFRYSKQEAL